MLLLENDNLETAVVLYLWFTSLTVVLVLLMIVG